MVKIINGDILDSQSNIIAHQVNCQGVMGSGVAKAIRDNYPYAYKCYKEYVKENTPKGVFGFCQLIPILSPTDTTLPKIPPNRYIANLFGQFNYGYNGDCYTNIDKLRSAMLALSEFAEKKNYSVCFPYKIGCVRGGANWDEVYQMICNIFKNVDVEIRRLDRG